MIDALGMHAKLLEMQRLGATWGGEDCFTVFKLLNRAPRTPLGALFLVFLAFPQGSLIVHSFCTSRMLFPVAIRNKVAQSDFIENVRGSWARLMIAAEPAVAGNSRG
jgi:hypothetical protein